MITTENYPMTDEEMERGNKLLFRLEDICEGEEVVIVANVLINMVARIIAAAAPTVEEAEKGLQFAFNDARDVVEELMQVKLEGKYDPRNSWKKGLAH